MYLFKNHKLLLILGILCILYFIVLKLLLWSMAFAEFWLALGCVILAIYFLCYKNINLLNYFPPLVKKLISIFLIIGIILFLIVEGFIIYNGTLKEKYEPDYILVLGAGLNGDQLSASLRFRLLTALEIHQQYPEVKIVVSGGQGKGEDISEALAMKKFLLSKGIPDSIVIMEDKSTSTYENFKFSKAILEEFSQGDKDNSMSITVITNNFHMLRAKYIGEKVGFKVYRYSAPCSVTSSVNFYVREAFALVKTVLFNK